MTFRNAIRGLAARSSSIALVACSPFASFGDANAQVVYSAGVQAIYDDNIFLEGDNPVPLAAAGTEGIPLEILDEFDGQKNDDVITNYTLGVMGAVPLTPALKTSAGIKAGFLVFSEQDDENRMTLDTALQADSEPMLVPDPFKVSVASRISSTNGRASVAQGTATRQSQVHVGSLTIGVAPQAVMEQTTLDLNYNLSRQDFLGEFLFKNDDEEQDPRFEERGSDFYTNAITASLKRVVNDRLEASFNNAVNYQTFTNSDSSDIDGVPVEEGDLDRLNYRPSLGGSYKLAERSLANASVGMDFTKFQGDQAERTLTVLNPDGTVTTIQRQPDDTQSSLFFSTAVNYFPTQGSSITLSADQSAGTDVDGDRLTMRSFALDAGSQIFESFSVGAGLRYSQFNNGDSLSGATERYEGTVSARYHLSQTLALALGYNYAQQKRGDAAEAAFFADGDYETNRVFISLDGGFVGVAS